MVTVAVVVPSGSESATSGSGPRQLDAPRWRCGGRRGRLEVVAAVGRGEQPQQPRPPGRLDQDRLEAAVGRVGAGVDLEAGAEVGQVREEELRAAPETQLGAVDAGADPVRASTRGRRGVKARIAWRTSAEFSAA